MKKEEIKTLIAISVAISIIIGFLYLVLLKKDIVISNVIRAVSFGVTAATLFWTFYFKYGWKWCLLNNIFYRPNLNGTWSGKLISDWKNEEGNPLPPIDFHIVIRQSFLGIHFTTLTNNFVGMSYAETMSIKEEKGIKNLAYLYKKDTTQDNNEILQEGATELRLVISPEARKLIGKYWSNKKTQGAIEVKFMSTTHIDSFEDAKRL